MLDINQIKITALEEKEDYGKYSISPLDRGYGQTLGNSLRRVMLTSLVGTAITAVKINGVKHEYTALAGLENDILEMVLNLKNLRVAVFGDEPVTLKLKVKGEQVVTAENFEKNSQAEIKNPDLYITTITGKTKTLDLEVTIEKGSGYVEANNEKRSKIDVIPLDADFSPVSRVSFEVKGARVGHITDYDELLLEIHTKSVIAPFKALSDSAKILRDIFSLLSAPDEEVVEVKPKKASKKAK
jgi:DNA-directed RNA polymerase subunit alpha